MDRVKDEQVSAQVSAETVDGDSKEERVEIGEEEEAGGDESEKDEGEQSDEAEAAESAEISTADREGKSNSKSHSDENDGNELYMTCESKFLSFLYRRDRGSG